MPKDIDHPSFQDWVKLNEHGKPSKQQIEAYDVQHGPTRRGIAKALLKVEGKLTRPRKRQP